MPGQSKVNGIWKTTTGLSVKVSGSWKTTTGAFIKVGGQWKQWFASKIQDAFNRASTTTGLGTADSGQVWNAIRGVWRISGSNAAVSDDAASTYPIAAINLGSSDVAVTMDVSDGVGAAFWVTDSGSWWSSYVRKTTSPSSYSVCNGGYAACSGGGCSPASNCCSGISQSTDFYCNAGGASCSGSGCQPSGCCSGVSYSGGGIYCSDYRTGQSSSSGCVGDCSSSGGGSSCNAGYTSRTGEWAGICCGGYSTSGGGQTCDRLYASSLGGYPSNCCGGYGTYDEQYVSSYSCAYNISSCTGRNCTPSGCCAGEAYILKNYYTGGVYYSDCWSGSSANYSYRTRYYCYTGYTQEPTYFNCYTQYTTNPTYYSGCWGYSAYPITGSCYTQYTGYTTRSCYTSYNQYPSTNYSTDIVIISSVSGTVTTAATQNISFNSSGFTQVGSVFVSTLGDAITAKAYSGSAQTGELATLSHTPSSPTKGTSVGIIKGPSDGSQGSTADTFLAILNT